ncbi:MAG: rhamnogalacturonan acetylesterase [Prevotella sp.]|nr:rhamnogalacturonan acetylesterase [Prevotella sp.]MDD6867567.1 rhamnogalacturonan acetylesterase [Prevotella sp.]MDY3271022.1 rhamnogalacturonan acetylesterase [Prevotella sp.]MDY5183406.1 rhamnogalacturonan acetylesterase [Prevotella sp.]
MKRLLSAIAFIAAAQLAAAQGFDNLPDPVEDVNKVVDNTPDSIAKALMSRPEPGTTRKGDNPVLFLIGNSTMRNGTKGDGSNGQWGWGFFASKYFNANKISVENQALGGMSTRTFYTKLWPMVRKALRKGDWVIISIGHNDNGPYDEGRARAVIPGVGTDSLCVTIKETGEKETVYTYGGYLRKYISECREAGAHPILMSLTPRDAYDEKTGKIVRKPQTEWAAYVAAQEGVPFVDLNEISGSKLDSYSKWKEQYHFFGDHIHTSAYGAEMNARSAAEGIAASSNPDLKPLQDMMMGVQLPVVQVTREKGKPIVFITGDSTVKNKDSDKDGMWGWGSQAYTVFDQNKVTCVNVAKAGRSTRSYVREGRWEQVYNTLQPGDFVLLQFGHNDICPIADAKERGVIPGTADTCHVYKMEKDGRYEVVYSFGWYLRKMIDDCREKGATPILVSLTPRNEWPHGKVERRNDSYGKWYREVVEQTGVDFLDVHNISADFLDRKFASKSEEKSKKAASRYFNNDHTHTSLAGARMNAQSVAKGLRDINSPLAAYLKKGK